MGIIWVLLVFNNVDRCPYLVGNCYFNLTFNKVIVIIINCKTTMGLQFWNVETLIMGNCVFHHGHFVEPLLTDMLAEYGLRLLFQPAYLPHLNTCELCFHQIKCFLKRNQLLAQQQTEIRILDACREITVETSSAYFRHCGYLK